MPKFVDVLKILEGGLKKCWTVELINPILSEENQDVWMLNQLKNVLSMFGLRVPLGSFDACTVLLIVGAFFFFNCRPKFSGEFVIKNK